MTFLEGLIAILILLSAFNVNLKYNTINKITGRITYDSIDLHFIFSIIAFLLFLYYIYKF